MKVRKLSAFTVLFILSNCNLCFSFWTFCVWFTNVFHTIYHNDSCGFGQSKCLSETVVTHYRGNFFFFFFFLFSFKADLSAWFFSFTEYFWDKKKHVEQESFIFDCAGDATVPVILYMSLNLNNSFTGTMSHYNPVLTHSGKKTSHTCFLTWSSKTRPAVCWFWVGYFQLFQKSWQILIKYFMKGNLQVWQSQSANTKKTSGSEAALHFLCLCLILSRKRTRL